MRVIVYLFYKKNYQIFDKLFYRYSSDHSLWTIKFSVELCSKLSSSSLEVRELPSEVIFSFPLLLPVEQKEAIKMDNKDVLTAKGD